MNKRRLLGRFDLLVLALIITAAAFIYILIPTEKGTLCEIKINGETTHIIKLTEHAQIFDLPENPNIIFEIKDNTAAFISSDCPDKICVNTGRLSYSGQSAACLPNRVSIHIIINNNDNEGNGLDIIIN